MKIKEIFSRKNILIACSLILVVGIAFTATRNSDDKNTPAAEDKRSLIEKIGLPVGKITYSIVQAAGTYPRIFQATIDPLDVHVGDKQTLSIVVSDPSGISSVVANIQTDRGTKELPLSFIREATNEDISKADYEVGDDGVVVASRSALPGIKKANADEEKKFLYSGEWIVHDTHDAKYLTTFVVKNNAGQQNEVTLTWSDACSIPRSGNWNITSYGNCTISSPDGVEVGTTTIATYTLTLNSTFVYNPNYGVTITSGAIAIPTGAGTRQLYQGYIYQADADNDSWPDSGTQSYGSTATAPAGQKRRSQLATNVVDCNPNNGGEYQYWGGYWDRDGDGYEGSYTNNICGGATFPSSSGYSENSRDCMDVGTGAANVYQDVYVTREADQDGWGSTPYSYQCVGPSSNLGFGGFPHYRDTSGNYDWASNAYGTNDCDDNNGNFTQTITGLYYDWDNDGYGDGTPASSYCSSPNTTFINGRNYYLTTDIGWGAYAYLKSYDASGNSDCNDGNGYIYATGGGGTDRNMDGYAQEGGSQYPICVGNDYLDTWYTDASGDMCWIRAASASGWGQSSAADGGGLCAQ